MCMKPRSDLTRAFRRGWKADQGTLAVSRRLHVFLLRKYTFLSFPSTPLALGGSRAITTTGLSPASNEQAYDSWAWSRSRNAAWAGFSFSRAVWRLNQAYRSTSGNLSQRPEPCGHSIRIRLLVRCAGSASPAHAHA